MLVDTHTHVIARDEARYPLQPSGVGSEWYRDAPCSAEELAALTEAAGVRAAVLVQAFGPYTFDNSYTVDAAAADPTRFVSVVIVDPEDRASPARLREYAQQKSCTGVRLFSIGPLDRPQPTWLDAPVTDALWEACGAIGFRVVVACLPEHLERLDAMLDRFPEQTVLLDHCGFVDFAGGPDSPNAATLYRLARHPHLHCKVTSHVVMHAGAEPGDAGAVVQRLVAEFGADRLAWGSDYPQTHDRPYADLVALATEACATLSTHDRDLVMGDTALRLWPELAT
jgi:predicted TIM-barrel fold metal-dependent hydrolase